MKKTGISILIPHHKEAIRVKNLVKLLLKEKVDKIVVVSTEKISLPKSKKIFLNLEKIRKGKWNAINLGLKYIDSSIIVMLSSDLRMKKGFLRHLTKHFENPDVGMVIGKPIADKNSKIYPFSKIIWQLHHLLCLKSPKGTEICAFRKVFNSFPKVIADEVFIEYEIRKAKLKVIYEPRATGYTKVPATLKQFLNQRKRIFIGHLHIKKKYGFVTSSMGLFNLFFVYLSFLSNAKLKELFLLQILTFIEILARFMGLMEFLILKKILFIW